MDLATEAASNMPRCHNWKARQDLQDDTDNDPESDFRGVRTTFQSLKSQALQIVILGATGMLSIILSYQFMTDQYDNRNTSVQLAPNGWVMQTISPPSCYQVTAH